MGDVVNWSCEEVISHLKANQVNNETLFETIKREGIDGKIVLALNETDIRDIRTDGCILWGTAKRFSIIVRQLQKSNACAIANLGLTERDAVCSGSNPFHYSHHSTHHHSHSHHHGACCYLDSCGNPDMERTSPPLSVDGRASSIKPEFFKTMISLCKYDSPSLFTCENCENSETGGILA